MWSVYLENYEEFISFVCLSGSQQIIDIFEGKTESETMCVEGSIILSLGDKSIRTLNILLNRMKVYIFCHQLVEYMVNPPISVTEPSI